MTAVERTAVMVVRIWIEGDDPAGFRARLTESSDLASREQTTAVAASVDEIVEIVHRWVTAFLDAAIV